MEGFLNPISLLIYLRQFTFLNLLVWYFDFLNLHCKGKTWPYLQNLTQLQIFTNQVNFQNYMLCNMLLVIKINCLVTINYLTYYTAFTPTFLNPLYILCNSCLENLVFDISSSMPSTRTPKCKLESPLSWSITDEKFRLMRMDS